MKIAQVSPLHESVPPRTYGGTERVVSYLTEALIELGHDVTLFASGDSVTGARLVSPCARALRLGEGSRDPLAAHVLLMEMVMARAARFDVVHWHIDYMHFPLSRRARVRSVTTLHGRLDLSELAPLYDEFRDMAVISISDAQRAPLPQARWIGTVHHGMPLNLYKPGSGDGGYLVFLGRISPEKRLDRAVAVARRLGMPLRVAAKVDAADREYFERDIVALLDDPLVEFLGEIEQGSKQALLGGARALLFPVDWPEPFGLVMIEAMACGTPVIAYRRGSVPEVMVDGVTGFVVDDEDSAAAAVRRLHEIDRSAVRMEFESRFSAHCMARRYLELYALAEAPTREVAA